MKKQNSTLLGAFVKDNWGLSFIVPGIIIGAVGLIHWLFLVPEPGDVDLDGLVCSCT